MKIGKTVRILFAIAGVQILLVGAYLLIDDWSTDPHPFAVERLDELAPVLTVQRDAAPVEVPDAPHLVHFWATWCAPCKEELPGLLAASEASGVRLLAVTDEPWPVVETYFDDDVPEAIVRDPSRAAADAWEVSGLPDTFVVRGGRIVGRMGGPRDWQTPEARAFLAELRR